MKLSEKLDLTLKGYASDPIAQFVFLWNSCGILIKEERIRLLLNDVPLQEITNRQKQILWKAISIIAKHTTPEERTNRNIDPDFIRGILIGISPILGKPPYSNALDEIVKEIIGALPYVDLVSTPGEEAEEAETEKLFKSLQDIPQSWQKPTRFSPVKILSKKAKQEMPYERAMRAEKIPSGLRPDFATGRTFNSRVSPHSIFTNLARKARRG